MSEQPDPFLLRRLIENKIVSSGEQARGAKNARTRRYLEGVHDGYVRALDLLPPLPLSDDQKETQRFMTALDVVSARRNVQVLLDDRKWTVLDASEHFALLDLASPMVLADAEELLAARLRICATTFIQDKCQVLVQRLKTKEKSE